MKSTLLKVRVPSTFSGEIPAGEAESITGTLSIVAKIL